MAITRACIDRFRSKFQHVTDNTFVQSQRVKGQGHSVRNRQHRFTAKSVGLSYLFNVSSGRGYDHVDCQAEVHNTSENAVFQTKKAKTPRKSHNTPERLMRCRSAFEMQCFRNCTLSSLIILRVLFKTRFFLRLPGFIARACR